MLANNFLLNSMNKIISISCKSFGIHMENINLANNIKKGGQILHWYVDLQSKQF
jgi:hypothetical protein